MCRLLKLIFFNGEREYYQIRGKLKGHSGSLAIATLSGVFWPTLRRPPWSTGGIVYYIASFFPPNDTRLDKDHCHTINL